MHNCSSHGHGTSRRGMLAVMGGAGAALTLGGPIGSALAQETKWLVDVHHHIMPPQYIKANLQSYLSQTSLLPASTYTSWTVEDALTKMDRANIRTAMVSIATQALTVGAIGDASKMSRICNEFGADMIRNHPGRFGIFALLPLPDVEASLRELEYAIDTLKLDGVGVVTSYDGKPVGHKDYFPVFDEINRRKLPVYVHVTNSCCSMPIEGIDVPTIDFPTDTTRAITSLAFGGTFARCPDIQFIFAHGGGTLPSIISRFGAPMKNFPPEVIKQRLPEGFAAMVRKQHFDVSGVMRSRGGMAAVLDMVPTSQLMYGTDMPFGVPNPADFEAISGMGLGVTEADMRAMRSGNALRMFPRYA